MKTAVASLLIAVSAFCTNASATILFAGGEDIEFTYTGSAYFTTGGYAVNASGYSRGAELVVWNGSAVPPANYVLSAAFAANSVVWVHAKYYVGGAEGNGGEVLGVLSPDGVDRILVRATTTPGQYKISTQTATGTLTDLVTMSGTCFTVFSSMDLYVNYSTSGEVTLYCNGAQVADYTGNVTTNSATQLNQVRLGGAAACGNCYTSWSEVIVATTSTRNMRLVTLAPAANGNTTNWDTGGVSNVNEVGLNDSTVNASGTSGQLQEYTVGSLPSGLWSVQDVWLNIRALVDTTGPQHVQGAVRTGATDYTSSNLAPSQDSFGLVHTDWPTNPNTGSAWTTSNLGAGFNIGFQSAN